VVENLDHKTIMERIEYIINAFKVINNKEFVSFKRFYSKERFLKQLSMILK
jgi:hypothetical protein